jgi:histidine ammonia-lyase
VRSSLAIEILTAAAGLDQRAPLAPSKGVAAAHAAVRERIAPLTEDRPLYGDIATVAEMIAAGSLARAAEAQVGRLA